MSDISQDWPPQEVLDAHPNYLNDARVLDVTDGDTVEVRIDLGYDIQNLEDMRLRGVDTREISFVSKDSEEYKRGMVHKEYVEEWVDESGEWPFIHYSHEYERGSYARVIGDLWCKRKEEWLSDSVYHEFDDAEKY